MKEPLGMTEVDHGLGHIVLDGTQLHPPRKRLSISPLFGACLLWFVTTVAHISATAKTFWTVCCTVTFI